MKTGIRSKVVAIGGNCPVEAIAGKLAAVLAEARRLDDARDQAIIESVAEANDAKRLEGELCDLQDALEAQIGWLTPITARGATLTLLQLLRTPDARARARLGERMLEYMAATGGASVAELGLSDIYCDRPIEREARARFAA